ncbi:MAG: cytochrome c biogenesis protein ResB [Nitrospirae bacterium]|nr:cytochrome c biogenesis protein ResB [Nitrospirota bacterium]
MYRQLFVSLKDFYRFFRSPKATIIIIAVLTGLFFTGLVIPQKRFYQSRADYERWKTDNPNISFILESLKLNEIYVSPITIAFLGLFFANLAVVVGHRIPVVLRRAYLLDRARPDPDFSRIKDGPDVRAIVLRRFLRAGHDSPGSGEKEDIVREITGFLSKRLWSIIHMGDGRSLLAVKNRYSPLGFLFFHLSFILCLVGGLLLTYSRFSGKLLLTAGQDFYSDMTEFREIREPRIFKAIPPIGIRVDQVEPSYEGGIGTDLKVRMRFRYKNEEQDVLVKVNEPVKKGPVAVLASNIGVSPLFVLRASDGREISGGYFILRVLKGQEDSFEMPSLPYKFHVLFYPEYAVDNGKEYSKSLELKNPVVHLRIERDEKTVYEGNLGIKKAASFDGLQVAFEDVRYWVDFMVIREYGTAPLFIGFILGCLGLVMRLVFYQKELRFYLETSEDGYKVYVAGKSEYYIHSFREDLDELVRDLQKTLTGSLSNEYLEGEKNDKGS